MNTVRLKMDLLDHLTDNSALFKGFAAKASEAAVESIKALGSEFVPTVEQDITFSTQDA